LPSEGDANRHLSLVKQDVIYSEWPDFLLSKEHISAGDADTFLRYLDALLDETVV
jgi:hypothetical protein